MAYFEPQLTTDNQDPVYHRGISNAWHFPSYHQYFEDIPFNIWVYDCVQNGGQNSVLYSLVLMLFRCVYYLLNSLLMKIVLFFCVLLFLVVKKFWRKVSELYDNINACI
jgi:hypothetical protein